MDLGFALIMLVSARQMLARRVEPSAAGAVAGAGQWSASLRLPTKVSSATSNFMIGVTAAASAGAYFIRGDIVTAIAGPVALGSVAGAVLGGRILMRVSNERLRLLFVAILVVLAVQMLLQAFGVKSFGG